MNLKQQALLILAVIFLGLAFSARFLSTKPFEIPKDKYLKIEATIKEEPKISGDRQILRIGDSTVFAALFPPYEVGDVLIVEGTVDSKTRIFEGEVTKVGEKKSFFGDLSFLRRKIAINITSMLPAREAAIVTGTVLGLDQIEKSFKEELIKTGTIHVVVVSGQNLTLIAGIFIAFAKYIGRRIALVLAVLAVFSYALLTGFEPPVVRASLMVFAATLAVFLGKETSAIWLISAAALLILFFAPRSVLDVSFQLTFAASIGIVILGQRLTKSWGKLPFLGQNAAIATSAYLFTMPVILYHFGQSSALALIANILVAELVLPIMILGFATAIFSLIFAPIALAFAWLSYVPAFAFTTIVEIFSRFSGSFNLGEENLLVAIVVYALIFALLYLWRQKTKS